MRIVLGFAIVSLLAGCNSEARQPNSAATGEPTAPIPPRPGDPTPDPITHPCVVAAVQYDKAIEQGSDVCKSDADCGCYQGGIGKSGCGGVLNKESVAKLGDIAKRFHDMKCRTTTQCAAWACLPKCENGHCSR